jgi:hypothetical protein
MILVVAIHRTRATKTKLTVTVYRNVILLHFSFPYSHEMNEYQASTSCSSGRNENSTNQTYTNPSGQFGSDPTILEGGDIHMYENSSTPPLLSVVWDSSLLAMLSAQQSSQASSIGNVVADRQQHFLDFTLAMVEEALAIFEDLDDQDNAPRQ